MDTKATAYHYHFESDRLMDYADEFTNIQRRIWMIGHTKKKRLRPHHPTLMLLGILLFLVSFIQISEREFFVNTAVFLTYIMFLLVFKIIINLCIKLLRRRKFQQMKGHEGSLSIDAKCVKDESDGVILCFEKDQIHRIVIGRDLLLFLSKQHMIIFVPRLQFQEHELLELLHQHYENKLLYWQYGQG